jgi:hypothetical protein
LKCKSRSEIQPEILDTAQTTDLFLFSNSDFFWQKLNEKSRKNVSRWSLQDSESGRKVCRCQ